MGKPAQVDVSQEGLAPAPMGSAFEERRAGGAHDQHRALGQPGLQMVDQIQGAVVGPLQVFQQNHQRIFQGQGFEVFVQINQGLLVKAFSIASVFWHGSALAEFEPEQLADVMGALLPAGLISQRRPHARLEFMLHHAGRVTIVDLEAEGEHLAQQRIGQVGHRGAGAGFEVEHFFGDQIQPLIELVEQTGFAHARLASDRYQLALPRLHGLVEGVLQVFELRLPADEAGLDTFQAALVHAKSARLFPQDQVRLKVLADTLDLDRVQRPDVEDTAHQPVGGVRDDQAAGRRGRLQPAGQIDRVAHHHEILALALTQGADQHLAGVHAHAHAELDSLTTLQGLVEFLQGMLHGQGGAQGALGIVLLGDHQAEHGHDGIADEFLHGSLLVLDMLAPAVEVSVEHVAHIFGIHFLGHGGEAHQVGE